jgi:hypothetical protein
VSGDIPVVFVESSAVGGHGENPDWFQAALAQAQEWNETVIWIGDHPHADESLGRYWSAAQLFSDHYVHLSGNHESFELFCLQRWFVLSRWMWENDVPVVLYLDSDVLLFANAQQEWDQHWKEFDFTLALGSSPATSFLTDRALSQFCSFLVQTYTERGELFQEMQRVYAEMQAQKLAGGISDMYLWRRFAELHGNVGEMTEIWNRSTWDHNINAADGFRMREGIKDIAFVEGVPCGLYRDSEMVNFKALHFQGAAKNVLQKYTTVQERVR